MIEQRMMNFGLQLRMNGKVFRIAFLFFLIVVGCSKRPDSTWDVHLYVSSDTKVAQAGSRMSLSVHLSNKSESFISATPSIANAVSLINSSSKKIYKVRPYINPNWPIDHLPAGGSWGIYLGNTGQWVDWIEFDKDLELGNYELQGKLSVTNSDGEVCIITSDSFPLKITK